MFGYIIKRMDNEKVLFYVVKESGKFTEKKQNPIGLLVLDNCAENSKMLNINFALYLRSYWNAVNANQYKISL